MRKQIDEAHWRDSARNIRFFIWDGKAAFPFLFVLLYPRIWTAIAAFIAMMFFTILNRYGFSVNVFLRWVRSGIAGKRKTVLPWWMS